MFWVNKGMLSRSAPYWTNKFLYLVRGWSLETQFIKSLISHLTEWINDDEKFKVFKGGMSIIDIGAAPGSWSQYVSRIVKSGKIISIDLKEMEKIQNTIQIQGDFTDNEIKDQIKKHLTKGSDVVMSDMAVNTTGIKNLDSLQTGDLCKEAMLFSKEVISEKGVFISKIFMGSTFNEIVALGKKIFKEVKVFKPKSSRKDSKESFIICKNLR
mgnify:CR=1 FL=1